VSDPFSFWDSKKQISHTCERFKKHRLPQLNIFERVIHNVSDLFLFYNSEKYLYICDRDLDNFEGTSFSVYISYICNLFPMW